MINVYSVSFAKVQWVSRNTLNQKQTNGPNPSTVYHPLSKCRQFFCWSYFTNLEVNPPPKIAMETAAFLREDFSSGPSDRHLAKVAVPRICKSWRLLFSWEFFYKSIELTKKLSFYTNKRGITHIYIYIYIYGYGSKNCLDRPAVIRTSGTRGLRKGAWSRGFQGPN